MSLYYLFSKTNFLIPTVSCVRHIFVGTQSTFLKLTDPINYNLCDLCQLISNAYSESGTLPPLVEEISGKQTAEQILLVAKQSDRCYKHLLKLCARITIYNLSFCISLIHIKGIILWSYLESGHEIKEPSYNVSLTPV